MVVDWVLAQLRAPMALCGVLAGGEIAYRYFYGYTGLFTKFVENVAT